jgi:hypothetical protein
MEQNQQQEEEIEEEDDELSNWDAVKGIAYILLVLALTAFLFYQIGKGVTPPPEKVIDVSAEQRAYDKGYNDGKKFGEVFERSKWCEPERTRKPGDMSLDCLKLFLNGTGSSLMEKNGIKIQSL